MRPRLLVTVLACLLGTVTITAPAAPAHEFAPPLPTISPKPARISPEGRPALLVPSVLIVRPDGTDPATLDVVRTALRAAGVRHIDESATTRPSMFTVRIGQERGTPESYVLTVGADRQGPGAATLTGADPRGTFYAAQSFRQVLEQSRIRHGVGRLPGMRVTDRPAMPIRGSIEGFYGNPWSAEDRLDQMDFYGRHKLNTYVYAPKDDPYHREKWREPYPEPEARQLGELVRRAQSNQVDFTFALSPGIDICFSAESDVRALLGKFENLYGMGVRHFNIPFDDINYTRWNCPGDEQRFGKGSGATAGAAQAYLLNRVVREFVATHQGVAPLQTVATEYANNTPTEYKATLKRDLDPSVLVQWTGIGVIAPRITVADANGAREVFGHQILVWDNYPVNDYRDAWGRLLIAPYINREAGLSSAVVGITANPMNQAAASKIALFNVADFTWNDTGYDPAASWQNALTETAGRNPRVTDALRVFADLNYARPRIDWTQAPELKAAIDRFWPAWQSGDQQGTQALRDRVARIVAAPAILRNGVPDKRFLAETDRWLSATELWGQAAAKTVEALDTLRAGDPAKARALRADAQQLVVRAQTFKDPYDIGRPERGQTPVRIADGVLDTFLHRAWAEIPG